MKNPESIFYDVEFKTYVSIAEIEVEKIKIKLVVVHKKENDTTKIITVYPCKNIDKEIKKKEGVTWLEVK